MSKQGNNNTQAEQAYGFTHEDTAKSVIRTIENFIKKNELKVYFVVQSDDVKEVYCY